MARTPRRLSSLAHQYWSLQAGNCKAQRAVGHHAPREAEQEDFSMSNVIYQQNLSSIQYETGGIFQTLREVVTQDLSGRYQDDLAVRLPAGSYQWFACRMSATYTW